MHCPVCSTHRRAVWSAELLRACRPLADSAQPVTAAVWPSSFITSTPVTMSQTRSVWSTELVSARRPSAERAAGDRRRAPLEMVHVPSSEPERPRLLV